jgi:hypothetical protein
MWEVELDGPTVESEFTVAAERGRLLRRIDAWNSETAQAIAAAVTLSRGFDRPSPTAGIPAEFGDFS